MSTHTVRAPPGGESAQRRMGLRRRQLSCAVERWECFGTAARASRGKQRMGRRRRRRRRRRREKEEEEEKEAEEEEAEALSHANLFDYTLSAYIVKV